MEMPQSDNRDNPTTAYKRTVREYLRANGEVAAKEELRAGTDVPAWYIDQIASTDTFYTSLNHNHDYVASKHVIGHRSTHDGFWRPEVDVRARPRGRGRRAVGAEQGRLRGRSRGRPLPRLSDHRPQKW